MNLVHTGCFSIVWILTLFLTANSFAQSESTPELFISNQITCGNIDGKWLPGVLKAGKRFFPYKNTLLKLKEQLKIAPAEKYIKLELKNKKFKLLNKTGLKECKNGPPREGANPVQTPSQTPSPHLPGATPTPRPTPKGCFNSQGQTTCFGIGQAGLVGNVTIGKNIFENGNGNSTSCVGCHNEADRRNRTFSEVSNALKEVPEMITYRNDFSNSDIANIVAYLNRFN